nr:odorant binding proteins OBP5 [Peridroma saucia]
MLKLSVVCFSFAVVAVNFRSAHCMSDEDKQAFVAAMKPMAEECGSDCGLTEEDFKKHNKGEDMDPCFKKCIMQKMGLLDDSGKYNREVLHESISEYTGDKDEAKKIQDQLDGCFDANGDNDGDDEESQMKRVDVLFNCLKELKE